MKAERAKEQLRLKANRQGWGLKFSTRENAKGTVQVAKLRLRLGQSFERMRLWTVTTVFWDVDGVKVILSHSPDPQAR